MTQHSLLVFKSMHKIYKTDKQAVNHDFRYLKIRNNRKISSFLNKMRKKATSM